MSRFHRVIQSEFPIHITARANNRDTFPIRLKTVWDITSAHLHLLNVGFGIQIHSYVLMPNHLHMIVSDPNGTLPKGMRYFMTETSREVSFLAGRINHLWGGRYHSSVISSPLYYLHAYKYVYQNPLAAGLIDDPLKYEFSTLPVLLGLRHGVIPMIEDATLFSDLHSTIRWLRESYSEETRLKIQKALKRKKFAIPALRKSREQDPLNQVSSVPETLSALYGTDKMTQPFTNC